MSALFLKQARAARLPGVRHFASATKARITFRHGNRELINKQLGLTPSPDVETADSIDSSASTLSSTAGASAESVSPNSRGDRRRAVFHRRGGNHEEESYRHAADRVEGYDTTLLLAHRLPVGRADGL